MQRRYEENLGLKPSLSILFFIAWLIFLILWFAFYSSNYTWEKNLAVFLVSILMLFIILGGMWAIWFLKMMPKKGWELFKLSGFRLRIITSIIIPLTSIIILIIWFWYFAEPFDIWQNIAVLLTIILSIGGILGVIWMNWSMKHSRKLNEFEKIGREIEDKFENENK